MFGLGKLIRVRTTKQEFEVADVIRRFEAQYRARYPVTPEQARVMAALKVCRTAELGGQIYQCEACGVLDFVYCSCRDRHCPKCCKFKKAEWVARQKVLLLPIPYFHLTFTIDHALNPLILANRKLIYEALFWAVSETLKRFGQKQLGGTLGITAVLHSWGQRIDAHPHIHCIVTGGALSLDELSWQASGRRYLFDVVKLSAAYRDRFCRKLKRLYKSGQLKQVGSAAELDVEAILAQMRANKWEVFAKPFDDPGLVYEYLSRYVHQVALSNYRIVMIAQGQVHFRFKDNKDGGKEKTCILDGVEFLRRFLWHVFPEKFRHIRHYGLHHSYHRRRKLKQARKLLGLEPEPPEADKLDLKEWLKEILGSEAIDRCPNCGAENSMSLYRDFAQPTWLQLLIFSLLGISLLGRVKKRTPA